VKSSGLQIKHHIIYSFRSSSLFYLLVHSRRRGFLFSLDHTQKHTTVGMTPLDGGSACRRDLYRTTQTLYKTNIHAPGGIPTHDPSKRSVADLRLRQHCRWDRPLNILAAKITSYMKIHLRHHVASISQRLLVLESHLNNTVFLSSFFANL
jgi:hypothetical protein